jgi:hypothetical protein
VTAAVLTGVSGTATITANTVQLRGLALSAGSTAQVALTLEVPCRAGAQPAWGVTVKQSTRFDGSAIAMSPDSSLGTALRGTCKLLWGDPKAGSAGVADREPTAAKVGDVITSVPYTPSGPSVRVAVHDGDGVLVAPAPGTSNAVAVDVTSGIGAGNLTGGASALAATTGYATFAALKIDEAGTYALRASVTSGRFARLATKEVVVRADTIVRQCTSASCLTERLRGGSGIFSVGAGSGTDVPFLTLSVDAGVSLSDAQCDGWAGYTQSTALFNVSSDQRTKLVSLTIDKPAMNEVSDNGAPRLELCFGSPVEFTAKHRVGGALYTTPVTGQFDWNADGRPENVYSGLLPDCSPTVTLCVSKRKKVGVGDGYIEATVPKSIGDPLMRG